MANYYAVKKGIKPGIYTNWDECKKNVIGFPGAVYKGFSTIEEAEEFMNSPEPAGKIASNSILSVQNDTAIAYVDGSFDIKTNRFSYGCLIRYADEEIRLYEAMNDINLAGMRNVAGEIKGAEAAIRYCIGREIKKILIVHDYEGISKWVTGEWAAKNAGTRAYRDFCKSVSSIIDISFVSVKGHSGDVGNEEADRLAKEALGIKK